MKRDAAVLLNFPPERRRRIFAIYIVVTILGGATLILLVTLLGLLYWMYADFPLPDPARLIHPEAAAYCIMDIEPTKPYPREVDAASLHALTGDGRSPVAPLVQQGVVSDACPVRIAISLVPGKDTPYRTFAVALGKFPGMFFLKRRDIERRIARENLSASVSYHKRKAVFVSQEWQPFTAVSLVRCSVLRSTAPSAIAPLIDRILAEKLPPSPWPDPEKLRMESPSPSDFWGWSRNRPSLDAKGIAGESAAAKIAAFERTISDRFPSLNNASDFRFWGQTFPKGFHLRANFKPAAAEDGRALARELPPWLREHGDPMGISEPETSFDPKEGRVKLKFRVNFRGR